MTRLTLSNEIRNALHEIEARARRLGEAHLDETHPPAQLLDEITTLYGAVALCRALVKKYQALEEAPPEAACDRPPDLRHGIRDYGESTVPLFPG